MSETRNQGRRPSVTGTIDTAQLPSGAPSPGMVIAGKFALQREIASGGMGVVFEARDLYIERSVAIKLMHADLTRDPVLVARFRREAQAAARIQHPNVVTVHEVGKRRDGTFYMVQELLSGQTLRELLDERGRLDPSEVFSIIIPVMGGLGAAHVQNIVHRDIKPENIVLAATPSGEIVPKVIDFGIAKLARDTLLQSLTSVGSIMGTPEYMAPEQVRGERVDARSDIWAVGVLLFEMLAGKVPFGGSPFQLLQQLLDKPIPRLEPHVGPELWPVAEVVGRALERDLDARIATMAEFRDQLLAAYGRGAAEAVAAVAPVRIGRASQMGHFPGAEAEPEWNVIGDLEIDAMSPMELSPPPPSLRMRAAEPVAAVESQGPQSIRVDVAYEPLEMAEHAINVNALHEAIGWAELALPSYELDEAAQGRAWMVLAVAHRWLGAHADAARAAQAALSRLPPGSAEWHSAFGHLVTAYGYLGRTERLLALVDELRRAEEDDDGEEKSEASIVTLCRLAVYVLRAGVPDLAQRLLGEARAAAKALGAPSPVVRAWLDVARAEAALSAGHLASYVRSVELAIDHFTTAGDVRSACLEQSSMGNAYIQIGAWDRATSALRESLAMAEPMQLELAATAKARLGYALAMAGRNEEGIAVLSAALESCVKHGNRRAESIARIYLARLLVGKKDRGALDMAKKAVEATEGLPARRAFALAALASIELELPASPTPALPLAREAMAILDKLGGVEEGESLIRLVHVMTLRLEGKDAQAKIDLMEAKRRLVEKADRLGEAELRRSFLERVPDNARLLAFGERAARD